MRGEKSLEMDDSTAESLPPQEKPKRSRRRVTPESAERQSSADARESVTPKTPDKPSTPANILLEEQTRDGAISKLSQKPSEGGAVVKIAVKDDVEFQVVSGHLPVAFSTQQTVTLGGLTFALFTKSLQTLITLRDVPQSNQNEIYYSLVVLLYLAMLLNILHAIVLVWLGIVKKDGTQEQQERAQSLIHMSSFVTLIMILLEICTAILHVHVIAS